MRIAFHNRPGVASQDGVRGSDPVLATHNKTFGIGNTDFILCASQLVRVLLVDRWLRPLWANFGFLQLLKYLEMVFGFGKVAKFGKDRTQ